MQGEESIIRDDTKWLRIVTCFALYLKDRASKEPITPEEVSGWIDQYLKREGEHAGQ